MTFNRYYISYPLCCPSRVSLLTGRYAHNHNVHGNVPPNGGYTGFQPATPTPTTSPPGCRAPATARSTSASSSTATATNPSTTAPTCRPAGAPGTRSSTPTPTTTSTATRSTTTARSKGPFGDSGSWETREYGDRDDVGCPYAPLNGQPCFYETDVFNRIATEEMQRRRPPEQPFYMQLDYTAPHGDFRHPAGPRAGDARLRLASPAPRFPHGRAEGFNEGNVNDKPRFIREAPYLSPTEIHTYRVYYQNAPGLAALGRRRRQTDRRHARRPAPAAQHLHHLHLRQRLLLRRAPAHRRQVPRLRALDPPAVPDPRPGDQTGHLDRRAGGQHRHRADDPRTGRRRQPTRASTDARWSPSCTTRACARGGRSSSSPSSRPTTSKRTAAARRRRRSASRPATPAAAPRSTNGRPAPCRGSGAAPAPRSSRRRRTTRDPPRPLQVHRVARRRERALRHQQGPLRAQQHGPRPQPLPDPRLPPQPADPPRELRRPHLPGSRAEIPADPRPAAQGRQGTARRRTAAKEQEREQRKKRGTRDGKGAAKRRGKQRSPRVAVGWQLLDDGEDVAGGTAAPSSTLSEVTLPARWAVISFSIFIASITQIRSPSATSAPSSTLTLKTVPCSGEGSASLEAPPPPPALRSRFGGFLPPAAAGAAPPATGLADHLDVEELAGDLDLVVAGRPSRRPPPRARARRSSAGAVDFSHSRSSIRSRQVSPLAHCSVREDRLVEGDQRGQAAGVVFAERAQHAPRRLLAVDVPDDQLGHHRVVHRRHLAAALDAGVDAHAGAGGLAVGARRSGPERGRISCAPPRR